MRPGGGGGGGGQVDAAAAERQSFVRSNYSGTARYLALAHIIGAQLVYALRVLNMHIEARALVIVERHLRVLDEVECDRVQRGLLRLLVLVTLPVRERRRAEHKVPLLPRAYA